MSTKPKDPSAPIADAAVGQKMFPDRTTEEVVAEIVASQPGKHSTTLEERLARAKEAASAGDEDAWEGFARARVSEIGGDFDEMLPGNKPRYTVEENGDVKDHDTGQVHKAINEPAPEVPGPAVEQEGDRADAPGAAAPPGDQHDPASRAEVAERAGGQKARPRRTRSNKQAKTQRA